MFFSYRNCNSNLISIWLKLDVHFELAAASEIGTQGAIIRRSYLILLRPDLVQIDLGEVVGGERQGILRRVTLNRLCLIHKALEVRLLELEVLFLERGLLASLSLCFVLTCAVGTCQNKALIDVRYVIIIQMLGVVFIEVGAHRLLIW